MGDARGVGGGYTTPRKRRVRNEKRREDDQEPTDETYLQYATTAFSQPWKERKQMGRKGGAEKLERVETSFELEFFRKVRVDKHGMKANNECEWGGTG